MYELRDSNAHMVLKSGRLSGSYSKHCLNTDFTSSGHSTSISGFRVFPATPDDTEHLNILCLIHCYLASHSVLDKEHLLSESQHKSLHNSILLCKQFTHECYHQISHCKFYLQGFQEPSTWSVSHTQKKDLTLRGPTFWVVFPWPPVSINLLIPKS